MADWLVLGTACMLGVLHALEIDHMLAVTTFVSRRPALATAARFGARWGLGHSVAVLLAGSLILVLDLRWPERWDAWAEAAVGVMLVGLGAWAILSARKLHLHDAAAHGDHAHLHVHRGATLEHAHPHHGVQGSGPGHDHGGITLVGFLHGLAGTSAVVALVPVTLIDRTGTGFGYLVAFGVGLTVSMTVFALVAAFAMRQAEARSLIWGRRAAMAVGVAGIVAGFVWVVRAAGSFGA